MDDIAALLGISKKTIYTVFQDKNTLVSEMVDYCFDSIKESEQKVLSDTSLDTVGKIRAILGVLPEGYKDIDFRQLYLLKDKYPKIYKKVEQRLETDRLGDNNRPDPAGNSWGHGQADSDSNFENHDGGNAWAVFPERYSDHKSDLLQRSVRGSGQYTGGWNYKVTIEKNRYIGNIRMGFKNK